MQKERIKTIMQSNERISQSKHIGGGLLIIAKDLAMSRSSQHYGNEYSHDSVLLDIYIEVISDLRKVMAVDEWMNANKEAWSWLEQWLRPDSGNISDRSDRSRRDGTVRQNGFDQTQSDSDLNGINESDEEDDDDSRFEAMESYSNVPSGVLQVQGAGIAQVNGIYTRTGSWDQVDLYTKHGIFEDREEVFTLFRCRLSDNSKRWYISIIPRNNNPGTSKDIDFYMATANNNVREVPHNYTWMSARAKDGDAPPTVVWKQEIGSGNISDRSDRSRRDGTVRQNGFDQTQSDSDLNGINESDEEDDDDSRFEAMESYSNVPSGVLQVQGAGIAQVNGIYTRTGSWDQVDLYTKHGIFEDREEVFTLFRCRLSDNSKRWYISIIPRNNNPGTSKDIDFYMATANNNVREVPHNYTWMSARAKDGDAPPTVVWKQEIGLSDDEEDPAAGDCVAIEQ